MEHSSIQTNSSVAASFEETGPTGDYAHPHHACALSKGNTTVDGLVNDVLDTSNTSVIRKGKTVEITHDLKYT